MKKTAPRWTWKLLGTKCLYLDLPLQSTKTSLDGARITPCRCRLSQVLVMVHNGVLIHFACSTFTDAYMHPPRVYPPAAPQLVAPLPIFHRYSVQPPYLGLQRTSLPSETPTFFYRYPPISHPPISRRLSPAELRRHPSSQVFILFICFVVIVHR